MVNQVHQLSYSPLTAHAFKHLGLTAPAASAVQMPLFDQDGEA